MTYSKTTLAVFLASTLLTYAPSAMAKDKPKSKIRASAHIVMGIDKSASSILLEKPEGAKDDVLTVLDAVSRIKRREYPILKVTMLDMARNKVMFTGSVRELTAFSEEELAKMLQPEKVCAPFENSFNYLNYRLDNDAPSDVYVVLASPLIDMDNSYCDVDRPAIPPKPPIMPKASYGMERIFTRPEVKGAYFLGFHHAQEQPYDEFITAMKGVEPQFVSKAADMHKIFSELKHDEEK